MIINDSIIMNIFIHTQKTYTPTLQLYSLTATINVYYIQSIGFNIY